jgi:hypothetical protein
VDPDEDETVEQELAHSFGRSIATQSGVAANDRTRGLPLLQGAVVDTAQKLDNPATDGFAPSVLTNVRT